LGYTLVELLVVVAIIGLLAGVLVTLIDPATQLRRGRDTQRKSDLSRIQSSIEIFRADLSAYPCVLPGAGCAGTLPAGCGLPLTGGAPPSTYMNQVPCDPSSPPPTVYIYSTNAAFTAYCLRACLEDLTDKERDEDPTKYNSDNPSNGITGCNFSETQICNTTNRRSYTVQNP